MFSPLFKDDSLAIGVPISPTGTKARPSSAQARLGQFMTPPAIANFMAAMFNGAMPNRVRLLDPGAGRGALTAAFAAQWSNQVRDRLEVHAYEFDGEVTLELARNLMRLEHRPRITTKIVTGDFIENAVKMIKLQQGDRYSHAILNPPYKRINAASRHRELLRAIGLETVNLYTGFLGLALELLEGGGQLVAIIPRSFCNGPYYRPFRTFMLRRAAIRQIHLFESRNQAFKADDVLQENVIVYLERNRPQGDVVISASTDDTFRDIKVAKYNFERIVFPDDPEGFIHIPTSDLDDEFVGFGQFRCSLMEVGISVSTGPVVDFRLRDWLCFTPEQGAVPLLYARHFTTGGVEWPVPTAKKPDAIRRTLETEKLLYPSGYYTVVRRFSSKEERRRIVSSVVDPARLPGGLLGFENHLNVFHQGRNPLPERLARGLSVFLNSTPVDRYFRRFNGHTQVNATDLRTMKYPDRDTLSHLGDWAVRHPSMTQEAIDRKIRSIA